MSYACDLCGKGKQTGMNVPHSKHKTKRRFLPNLQAKTLIVGGEKRRLRLCTSCIKKGM